MRPREWLLLVAGAVLAAGLFGAGEGLRALVDASLGLAGASTLVAMRRRRPRWPRLRRALGRAPLRGVDPRLDATLDGVEDALGAIAQDGAPFADALLAIESGAIDLARRALSLSRVRVGHEATLARVFLEAQASDLERAARAELERVGDELERLRGLGVTIGPSVRHLRLCLRTEEIGGGDARELGDRLATLREALTEELAHA